MKVCAWAHVEGCHEDVHLFSAGHLLQNLTVKPGEAIPTEGAILHKHTRQEIPFFFPKNMDMKSGAEAFFAHMEIVFKNHKSNQDLACCKTGV